MLLGDAVKLGCFALEEYIPKRRSINSFFLIGKNCPNWPHADIVKAEKEVSDLNPRTDSDPYRVTKHHIT